MTQQSAAERAPAVGGFVYPLHVLSENAPPLISPTTTTATPPMVRDIGFADLRAGLAQGWADFTAHRTDVMFLCLLYPALGLVLFRFAIGHQVLALLFPLAAGFALIGPVAATGLYEMSRRLELGETVTWRTAFAVLHARAFGAIAVLGCLFAALFVIWLQVALAIYEVFLGNAAPASFGDFLRQVFATRAGWYMIVEGNLVGFCFAVIAFAFGALSFPMLIDGRFGRSTGERMSLALGTSLHAMLMNPGPMLAWGLLVAVSVIVASVPFFLGLVVVLPVLGHATWHLYRRTVGDAA